MKNFIICSFVLFLFVFESTFPQDTTRTEKKIIPAPKKMETKKTEQEKIVPEKSLPPIDMKEYIIKGKEEIKLEPAERNVEVKPEVKQSEKSEIKDVPEVLSKRPFEQTEIKSTKIINIPVFEEGNLFHLTYGRYNEFDAGAQIGKVYKNDEVLLNGDFRRTSGFKQNADMYNGNVSFSDFHRFKGEYVSNLYLDYARQMYKFYGSPISDKYYYPTFNRIDRKTEFLNGMFQTNLRRWSSLDIGLEAGGRVGNIDDFKEVSDKGVNGKFYVKKVVGNAIIKGEVSYGGEFLNRNNKDSKIDLFKGNFEIEGNVKKVFSVILGVNAFSSTNTNDQRLSKFYPRLYLGKLIQGLGEIYGEFAPEVSVINMISALDRNRYIDTNTEFSYVDTPLSLRVGWKNRKLSNFNWEVYYLYQRLENFGIEVEQRDLSSIDLPPTLLGIWDLDYKYKTQLQGVRFLMNWQKSNVLNLWTSVAVMDYSELEYTGSMSPLSAIIGDIPYHPNFSGDFTLDISPGGGVKFEMTGRYIGSRFISAFADDKLDSYFLVDMSISKRLNKNVSLSAKIFNLFNQKYETRRNYDQPDIVSVMGLSFFW